MLLRDEPGGGGPAGNPCLQSLAVGNAAPDVIDQLTPGDPVRQFVVPGTVDVPRQRGHEGPGVGVAGES